MLQVSINSSVAQWHSSLTSASLVTLLMGGFGFVVIELASSKNAISAEQHHITQTCKNVIVKKKRSVLRNIFGDNLRCWTLLDGPKRTSKHTYPTNLTLSWWLCTYIPLSQVKENTENQCRTEKNTTSQKKMGKKSTPPTTYRRCHLL